MAIASPLITFPGLWLHISFFPLFLLLAVKYCKVKLAFVGMWGFACSIMTHADWNRNNCPYYMIIRLFCLVFFTATWMVAIQ